MAISEALKIRDQEQKARLNKVKKDRIKNLASEPTMKVQVRNHDFVNQGVPIEFTFQGIKKYKLEDGKEYDLPVSVIDHLNRLQVPDSRWETDEKTGQLKHVKFMRKRFSAIPVAGFTSVAGPKAKEKAA